MKLNIPHSSNHVRFSLGVVCALSLVSTSASAAAQLNNGVPLGTENTGVSQKLGAQVPLEQSFRDQEGRTVTLGDSFREGRPVVLTLNYSDCPQLCILQLDGVVKALNGIDLELGKDLQLVTLSLDPTEAPARAKLTQELYLKGYTGQGDAEGWTFLVADDEADIRRVADSVGFGYDLDLRTGEYSHEAALMLLTPDGQVSRYLFGIEYDPTTLRMSLISASDGALGSLTDRIRMFCYRYDPEAGSYSLVAMNVMKLGGLVTVLVLGGFLFFFWRQELMALLKGSDTAAQETSSGAPLAHAGNQVDTHR